ncbi:unnamed protein product [Sphagnum jensenii]|uniref:Uncharacterized protein n=1 Tax=Sphagnum jensenii TaxID=128206 RepID=A0ABP0VN86_9BRYO
MRLLPVYYCRAYYKRVAIVEISFDIAVPVLLLLWIVNLRRSIAGSSSLEEEAGYGLFVSKDYLLTYNLCTSYKKIHGSEAEQSATRTLVNGDKLAAV